MSLIDFKVVLLGQEYIGKTSLVERFIYGSFAGENQYVPTIGAAFGAKKIQVNGRTVTMGLWDTAGSEKYNAISSIYYRNAHSAIVCYDITDTDTFERAKFWVSELKNHEQNCKVYLCGTKKDLILSDSSRRRVDYHKVVEYAGQINAELFETSSRTGEGVIEMFYKITENFINASESNRKKSFSLNLEPRKRKRSCC